MKYRSDIDGLRAVAVCAVLLFHGNLLGVKGGFLGVDIFFVISGYLITSILHNDIAAGRYSLLNFYDRRIRRILPAYAVVMSATTIGALIILPPEELANYGRRLASTALFVSNFYFRSETNYFSRAASDNPLLHTWSLSVEEQFYIVWPLLMFILAAPFLTRWRRGVVLAIFAGSLALASYTAIERPIAAFYYSPLRAWELLLGAIVALRFVPPSSHRASEWIAGIGLTLIVVPLFAWGGEIPFPGLSALPPCLGAAMIIYAGQEQQTATGKLLSFRPLVAIGLISYSLYLWHWPLLSFGRILLGHELDNVEASVLLSLALALSVLSWRYVEMPFRKRGKLRLRIPISVPAGTVALTALLVTGVAVNRADGWPHRSNHATKVAAAERDQRPRGTQGCQLTNTETRLPTDVRCLLGNAEDSAVVGVLLGDSHAGAYSTAIDELGRKMGFAVWQWAKTSCSPLLSSETRSLWTRWIPNRAAASCETFKSRAIQALAKDPKLKFVIVSAFWSSMQDDATANAERRPAGPHSQRFLTTGLERIVATLHQQGKTVILLGDPPVFPNGGGDCVVRQRFLGQDDTVRCRVSRAYVQELLSPSDAILESLSQKYPAVYSYKGSLEFCREEWCHPTMNGRLMMRDEHHLNYLGSQYVARTIEPILRAAGVGTATNVHTSLP